VHALEAQPAVVALHIAQVQPLGKIVRIDLAEPAPEQCGSATREGAGFVVGPRLRVTGVGLLPGQPKWTRGCARGVR
jgi:hypothetical protein